MSSDPRNTPGHGFYEMKLEDRLRRAAGAFPYPKTPDLSARERLRLQGQRQNRRKGHLIPARSLWALGGALLILAVLVVLLVSPVRARVLDWVRIGSVRIFFTQPTPTTTPLPSGTPSPAAAPSVTPTFLQSVLDLAGETSLANAQAQASFTIQTPAYPPDLGAPDHIYFQEMAGPVVVLVWMDKNRPGQVRMSLSESSSGQYIFGKYQPKSVQDTQVGTYTAVWVDGDYLLVTRGGDSTFTRLVNQSHTLIWTTDKMTFRLETDVDLKTALRIAQSMR